MPVRAHSELDQIKSGNLGSFKPKTIAQLGLIASGGLLGIEFTFHAVHLLGAQGHAVEHGFAGHPIVALLVVRRNASLIDPVKIELVPRHSSHPRMVWI